MDDSNSSEKDDSEARIDCLTKERITALEETYRQTAPFDLVEREHIAMLPSAFASGEFGRRDAEWVVQWYHRRGSVADDQRRAAESQFRDNTNDTVVKTVKEATTAEGLTEKMTHLTSLAGVNIAIGGAFLSYMHPDQYVAVGPRTWRGLCGLKEQLRQYPNRLELAGYQEYLTTIRPIVQRTDCEPWAVYRALWQLGATD